MASAGLLAAVHRQPGDLQSVHPAGGRRGALASASPGSQPSAIGNRPAARGFSGAVVLLCGDTDGLFPGRSAHGETRHGWYLRGDSAEQLPGLAQYLAAARPALVSQVSVLLAVVPEHHPPGASGAVAARLAAEYRPVPNLAKRSAAGVERVLGDAARRPGRGKPLVYRHAGEGWSPGAAEGTSAPVGCRVAAGGQPCLTPASDAVAGEHSVLGRKRSVPAIPRPAGGTSSAEPVCRGHLPDTGSGGGE